MKKQDKEYYIKGFTQGYINAIIDYMVYQIQKALDDAIKEIEGDKNE